jgi:hypothetical protein
VLAGYFNDRRLSVLDDASGYDPSRGARVQPVAVVIVAEPDLMNNFGLPIRERALAHAIVDAALEDYDCRSCSTSPQPGSAEARTC